MMTVQRAPTVSSSGLSRGSSVQGTPEQADGWMVGTSPTMTRTTQKLFGDDGATNSNCVILGLVPRIQRARNAGASGWMDGRDKPDHDKDDAEAVWCVSR